MSLNRFLGYAAGIAAAVSASAPLAGEAPPRTILFVGNSFTQGAHSAVRNWHASEVNDLNHAGYGGVPALFKEFTEEAGLNYSVSLETQGGKPLAFHYDERRQLFDRPWDAVVLQEHSELDPKQPGDPTDYYRDVARLTALFRKQNPKVDVRLMATWSRADLTYKSASKWFGKPVTAMAADLEAAADHARAQMPGMGPVLPVGEAWNRAFATGVADPNPYDGVALGQLDLWSYDQYHASVAGYYLEALIVFGGITGLDPMTLGSRERAADELGLSAAQATSLQKVAHDQLSASSVSSMAAGTRPHS